MARHGLRRRVFRHRPHSLHHRHAAEYGGLIVELLQWLIYGFGFGLFLAAVRVIYKRL